MISSAGISEMTPVPVDYESRPMSMRGEGFVEGEGESHGRALT